MTHKFKTAQMVTYSPAELGGADRNVKFEIVRLLPAERGIYQYRLKSIVDGHERVALESELSDGRPGLARDDERPHPFPAVQSRIS